MTRDNTRLLVVTGGVTGQFENFGSEVFENGSEVNRGTGTDTLGVVTLSDESVDTTDGELEAGFGRSGLTRFLTAGLALIIYG